MVGSSAAHFVGSQASPRLELGHRPPTCRRNSVLPVKWAEDGEPVRRATVYVAPPDRHLLLNPGHLRVLTQRAADLDQQARLLWDTLSGLIRPEQDALGPEADPGSAG